jgi:uncharacterized protein YlxP (DUF503 family)
MVVGICRLTLSIADSYSLKDKRRVVKSLVERLRHRFNVAVAEVDEHEMWNAAVIGVACVSTSSTHARDILNHVISFADGHNDAELVDTSVEILPGF